MNKRIIFYLFLPIFVLLLSYKVTMFIFPYTPEQLVGIDFLMGKGDLIGFNELETSHMQDVRSVMLGAELVLILSLIVVASFVYFGSKKEVAELFSFGGKIVVGVLGFFLFLLLVAFEFMFTIFHYVFFPQGNWQFPPGSTIIETFPIEFFGAMSLGIFVLSLLLGIVFIVLGKYLTYDRARS